LRTAELPGDAVPVPALQHELYERVQDLLARGPPVEERSRIGEERRSLARPLAAEQQPSEKAAQRQRQRREHDQHDDRDRHRAVRGAPGGPLPRGLTRRDQALELGGLSPNAVDERLAESGRGNRLGGGTVGGDLLGHARDVASHVGAGGVGQRCGPGHKRALVARGPLERRRGPRQLSLCRPGRAQELALARDHVAAQAGLGVDDGPFDVERGVQVVAGAER
jgi:hypothetical protein